MVWKVSIAARNQSRFSRQPSPAPRPSSGTDLPVSREFPTFEKATKTAMADAIIAATAAGATTVVGGGDAATTAKKFGADKKFPTLRPAAARSLEFLEKSRSAANVAALSEK